jgi:plastocyanin
MSASSAVRFSILALGVATATACGGSGPTASTSSALPPGYYVVITNMSYSPPNLAVPAGSTVTVVNRDVGMPHSVTQQVAPGTFTPGSPSGTPFDTGLFTGTRSFVVPAGLAAGTVLHYYCTSHGATMATPNGTITIDPLAQVSPGIDPGAPGGGTGY